MNIGFILGRQRPGAGSWVPQVIALLRAWGISVDEIYPDEGMIDFAKVQVEHDLYVLKPSRSQLALSYAGILHALGARMLNPYPVSAALQNKVLTTHRIQMAGVPVPHTAAVSRAEHIHELLDEGPIVITPHRSNPGQCGRLIRSPDDLPPLSGVYLAQRYHHPDGPERKIYSIGRRVFGVFGKFNTKTRDEKTGSPFTVEPELLRITQCCGDAFGIDTFGVDVIISDGRPYVIGMSAFPGFKGIPEATTRIADYLSSNLRNVSSNPPPSTIQTSTGS